MARRSPRRRPAPLPPTGAAFPQPLPWRWPETATLALLLAVTAAVYSAVRVHGFIDYDTPDYVTANPHVKAGLSLAGLVWALTTTAAGNWFPLTWLSHMLDVELFGVSSGPLHLVNLGLHLLATTMLYAWLRRMTASRWPPLFVAALFALHPLHVESVAWLAERKDVLSGLFWMLSLWSYARYVERPTRGRYALLCAMFLCGLMSKSMIVTLPAVLLLLDFWPLRRKVALREKIPLALLSLGAGAVTFVAQRASGAVASTETTHIATRLANAVVAYLAYLRSVVWPRGLAVFYPYPSAIPVARVVLGLTVLATISWLAWRTRRTRPYVVVGWCWFLGTLLPVIGLLQVGAQARADRYMYVPLVGLAIAVAWFLRDLAVRHRGSRVVIGAAAVAACMAFAGTSSAQVHVWQSTATLFRHAIAATRDNYVAYNALGTALADQGQTTEAIRAYTTSLQIHPDYAEAHGNLAAALLDSNRADAALPHLRQAIALKPELVEPQVNLGRRLRSARPARRSRRAIPPAACGLAGRRRCAFGLATCSASAASARKPKRFWPTRYGSAPTTPPRTTTTAICCRRSAARPPRGRNSRPRFVSSRAGRKPTTTCNRTDRAGRL